MMNQAKRIENLALTARNQHEHQTLNSALKDRIRELENELARILHMEEQENLLPLNPPPQNYYYSIIEDLPWYQKITIPVECCPECKGEGYLYTVCGDNSGMMGCPRCNGAKVIPII